MLNELKTGLGYFVLLLVIWCGLAFMLFLGSPAAILAGPALPIFLFIGATAVVYFMFAYMVSSLFESPLRIWVYLTFVLVGGAIAYYSGAVSTHGIGDNAFVIASAVIASLVLLHILRPTDFTDSASQ